MQAGTLARFVGKSVQFPDVNPFGGAPTRGAGVRKLQGRWYEVRAGLGWRLVFRECDDCLSFAFMGNHDDVQRFLKSAK